MAEAVGLHPDAAKIEVIKAVEDPIQDPIRQPVQNPVREVPVEQPVEGAEQVTQEAATAHGIDLKADGAGPDFQAQDIEVEPAEFQVEDVDAATEELRSAGVEIVFGPERSEDAGLAWTHFRAPDGNIYGVIEFLRAA